MPSDNLLSRNNSIDFWLGSHALVNELGALRLSVERAQGLGMGSSFSPFPALPEYWEGIRVGPSALTALWCHCDWLWVGW